MITRDAANKNFWPKVDKTETCWHWTGSKTKLGYGQFGFRQGAKVHVFYAHRVAYSLSVGEIPEGLLVLHHCDNPSCCNPDHLFVGTDADNMRDRDSKRRQNKGETVVFAKLKEADVMEIRQLYARGGLTRKEIGDRFGIKPNNVSLITTRKIWKHLP